MDALTHAVIGIALAGLSGQPLSINDPIYLAALLGSQAPDFDIIAQLKGSFSYLRQHRAFSHSIPGIILWSALIAIGLNIFFPSTNCISLFLWSLAGNLSHIFMDYFNTHGAAILWPFKRDRKSLQLLNVFDPILLTLMLGLYAFNFTPKQLSLATFLTIIIYIICRIILRTYAKKWLTNKFQCEQILQLSIMPSLKRILFWDFIIETKSYYIIGQIGALCPILEIKTSLPRSEYISEFGLEAKNTPLGYFFTDCTPFIYVEEKKEANWIYVNIYDLRYILDKQFLHKATIMFDDNKIPINSYMHSYGRIMKVPC